MPIYFDTIAPHCPISTDSSLGPRQAHLFNRTIFNRPTIPRVPSNASLSDVVLIANIARSIVTSVTNNQVRNNLYEPKEQGFLGAAQDKHKTKPARWSEQKDKRVKKKFKYYAKDRDGKVDKASWVIMERIMRMVWYDSGWKSRLTWEYGDKGEGELVVSGNKTAAELQA
jgi:hypothetical protein